MNYIDKIITESVRQLLTEGAIDNYIKKLIEQNVSSYLQQYLNTHVTQINNPQLVQTLKEGNPSIFNQCVKNPNMGTLKHYLRMDFLHYFDINRGKGPVEFLKGIARIAIEELGFCNDTRNEGEMSLFKRNVMFVHDNPQLVNIQFNNDLNGLDFYGFVKIVNKIRKEFNAQNRINLKSSMINNDYEIVPIMDEKQAQQYAPYVRWCVTRDSYHSYAKGGSRFYFCLKKGFENVPEEVGENCPLDEYGLSMIAVLVDMDGEPVHITTRWNHAYDGEDNPNLRTAKQFQELLGIDFYNTFLPYTNEELKKMGAIPFYEVQDMLDNGTDPKEIFNSMKVSNLANGIFMVELHDKYNFYNSSENKLLSKKWYDYIGEFCDGFARVNLGDKWTYIKTNGQILTPNQWYDGAGNFNDGLAGVRLGDKCYFIKTNGDPAFPNQWYNEFDDFSEGFAGVKKGDKWYFIKRNGEIAFPNQWYDKVGDFNEGLAWVMLDGKYYFINTNGKEAFPNQYYDYACYFSDGLAAVRLGDKWTYIKTNGDMLRPNQWYDYVGDFSDGLAVVHLGDKRNFIKRNGEIAFPNQWYDSAINFSEGFAGVKLDDKWTYINTNGDIVFPNQWYDDVGYFSEGFAGVQVGTKWTIINTNGKIAFPNQWYDYVYCFNNGFVEVELDDAEFHVDTKGNLWDYNKTHIIKSANTVTEMKIIKNNFYNLLERINRTW